jgi:hypothetical protein
MLQFHHVLARATHTEAPRPSLAASVALFEGLHGFEEGLGARLGGRSSVVGTVVGTESTWISFLPLDFSSAT